MKTCVFVGYHKADSVTLRHIALINWYNSHHTVVPVCFQGCPTLPGSLVVTLNAPDRDKKEWYNCDKMIYEGFKAYPNFDRYIWLEWDVLCLASIDEHYPSDVCDMVLSFQKDKEWFWFCDIPKLSPDLRPYARGVAPLVSTMLCNDTLRTIMPVVDRIDCFAELRLGTALYACGITPRLHNDVMRRNIAWNKCRVPICERERGIYHKVSQQ